MSRLEKVRIPWYTVTDKIKRRSGIIIRKSPYIYLGVFGVNFLLFVTKLYVGLSSNSISIYSDGMNNFFDSLTGILSFVLLVSLSKQKNPVALYKTKKTEQLLSFVISVTVAFSAFYFAYNSLERLTYPTPVSFTVKYLVIILMTAAVKLLMFVLLHLYSQKKASAVVRLISLDSLLDFFITSVTALTLILSVDGKYAIDAFCGIGISCVILFTAVKNLLSALSRLTESPGKDKRDRLAEILADKNIKDISFNLSESEDEVYIKTVGIEDAASLAEKIEADTGIKAYFVVCEE
ncbi:MAG: cation transporter [Clostridia bacterium]|nr:cation transporter [Clostridia bacterium]